MIHCFFYWHRWLVATFPKILSFRNRKERKLKVITTVLIRSAIHINSLAHDNLRSKLHIVIIIVRSKPVPLKSRPHNATN